jgi:hypothetical protein
MAWIAGDGFDYYGTLADVARSVWDVADTTKFALVTFGGPTGALPTRFGSGQMLQRVASVSGAWLTKTIGSNEATLLVALAYYRVSALSGTTPEIYLQFRDGATAQCTVVFESSGNIVLKAGTETGTVLATYTAAFGQDVWTHFQVRVTINNTAGAITVRKNGSTTDSFTATALNTRGGTANNYATAVVVGNGNAVAITTIQNLVDDVLCYSASGAAPNDWVGDVRAIVLPVSGAGASSQFTASTTAVLFGETNAAATVALSGDNIYFFGPVPGVGTLPLGPFPGRSGVLTKITVQSAVAMTGSVRTALYAVDAATGKPGTLLATSATVVNPGTGPIDFAVSAGPTLSSAQSYYLAIQGNAVWTVSGRTAGNPSVYRQAVTFVSGPPVSGLAAGTTAGISVAITATVTDAVAAVNDPGGNGDVDYLFDATVGHEDLYALADLPTTPAAIIGVVAKAFLKKSDAGSRNGAVRLRSGGTDVQGADTVLSSSYTYLARVDAVDPATGAAWTPAAVNALQVGQKVTA